MQFGALAPIFRSHCNHCNRYFWEFQHFDIMKESFHLRNALQPYIYTAARQAYETGMVLVRPTYMDFSRDSGAYGAFGAQYMFGPSLLVAPVSVPTDNATGKASTSVYLPMNSTSGLHAQQWCRWRDPPTATIAGGTVLAEQSGLQDVPIYWRSGAVLPMQTMVSQASVPSPLVWALKPGCGDGGSGHGMYYEDDGRTLQYQSQTDESDAPSGEARIPASYTYTMGTPADGTGAMDLTVTLGPLQGGYPNMPASRAVWVRLIAHGLKPSKVSVDGKLIPESGGTPGWSVVPAGNGTLSVPDGTVEVRAAGSSSLQNAMNVQFQW